MLKKTVSGTMFTLMLMDLAFLGVLMEPSSGDIPTLEIPLFGLLGKEVTNFQGGVNVTLTFRNYGFDATSGTVWIPWEKIYYSAFLGGASPNPRNITETLLQYDVNGDSDTSDVFTIYGIDNKTVEIDGVTGYSMFLPEQRMTVDTKLIYDVMERNSFVLGSRNYSLYRVLLPANPWDFGYAEFGVDSFFRYHPSPNIEFVIEQKATSINSTSTAEIISVELNGTPTPSEFNWVSPWFSETYFNETFIDGQWYVDNTYVYPLGFLNNGSAFTVHLSIRGEPGSYSLLTLINWAPDTLHRYRYLVFISPEYANEIPFTIRTSEPAVGVETGDWIKYDYAAVGVPPGTPLPTWLKVEFLSVEGTTADVRVTMHMSDGTEQNQTMAYDIISSGEDPSAFSGFVIPTNLTTGDSIYMSGYGDVMIVGETAGTYAGANRTVVYASFSQAGTQLTYYWDKQTGVLVEASTISGNITATVRATETNMWQALTIICLIPSEISVAVSDVFTVNVTVTNVTDLYSWEIKLFFDPTILNCTSAWYPDDNVFAGKEIVLLEPVIDNIEGSVLYGCSLLGEEQETFNGNGTLCQIQFRAISRGDSSLEFAGPEEDFGTYLLNFDLNKIPSVAHGGYIIVVEGGLYCDLNNDGKVSIQDIALAAGAFGSYPGHPRWNPIADVNRDKTVNVVDIVLIAKNFGKKLEG